MHSGHAGRVRGVILLLALVAALLVLMSGGAALADEDGAGTTTTTILAEGPTEPDEDDDSVLGPDSPTLPDTGAGDSVLLVVAGVVAIGLGGVSTVLGLRRR